MPYDSHEKTYLLKSPFMEENTLRMVRKSYKTLSTSLIKSEQMGASLLQELIWQMQREMKHICSLQSHDSILRDTKEDVTVKQFSWEIVCDELYRNIPTLISILVDLADGDVPLTCFIASMLLKKRLPKMCLVQRATSILL